jgi:2',3'-cyclic-nucleotide 2'-phosphodiesterase (5'-nucleotidase family)
MFRRAVAPFLLSWIAFCAAARLSPAEIRHITILHTNDLHARLHLSMEPVEDLHNLPP